MDNYWIKRRTLIDLSEEGHRKLIDLYEKNKSHVESQLFHILLNDDI